MHAPKIFLVVILLWGSLQAYARDVLFVSEDWPPFETLDTTGAPAGIVVDIVGHIMKNHVGQPFRVEIKNWAQAWRQVELGSADASLSLSIKEKRQQFVHYTREHVWTTANVFFYKKGSEIPDHVDFDWAKKHGLTVGVIRANSYHEDFWQAFPYADGSTKFDPKKLSRKQLNPQLRIAKDLGTNMRLLEAGKIDLFIIDRIIGAHSVKQMGLEKSIALSSAVLFSKKYYLGFAKNSTRGAEAMAKLRDQFDDGLRRMKKGSPSPYDQIMIKYLGESGYQKESGTGH